jgi:hypothetical protein
VTSLLAPLRRPLALVLAALAVFTAACIPSDPAQNPRTVMGPSTLTKDQLVWYFMGHKPPDGPYLTTTLPDLASHFIDEGIIEGVRGDIAFAQSLIETGWFRYGGQVKWQQNNFSGLGAVDGGGGGETFPNAATGVRAQMQHLRAYADPTATKCAKPPLYTECVDTRFDQVDPKGKAPSWEQMGNGNWATDPGYALKVVGLYNDMRLYYGLSPI